MLRASVFLAIVGYACYRAGALAMSSEALTVANIGVDGNSRMSKGEVIALLDGLRGANLLLTDLDGWRQKLLRSPWVAEASIRRVFPGTVNVEIVERQPLGIGRINDGLYLVDHRATVIDEYGPNYADLFRRSAAYVDRIVKGARAGDLPVEQPSRFEFLINIKTAKALGLTIPRSLLLRADQVIE